MINNIYRMEALVLKKISVFIMVLFLFSFPLKSVSALDCVVNEDPISEYKNSDLVFHGKLKKQKGDKYVFSVSEVYKGEVNDKLTGHDTLGFWLSEKVIEGEDYLVYSNYVDGEISISACSRTQHWVEGKNDVKQFLLIAEKHVKVEAKGNYKPLFYIAGGSILLMAIGAFAVSKRKRKPKDIEK